MGRSQERSRVEGLGIGLVAFRLASASAPGVKGRILRHPKMCSLRPRPLMFPEMPTLDYVDSCLGFILTALSRSLLLVL